MLAEIAVSRFDCVIVLLTPRVYLNISFNSFRIR
jgi:hypothetical protein